MSAPTSITRRMLIKDMGKAGLAVMVMGTAACTPEPTTTPPADQLTTTAAGTATTRAPATSSTGAGTSSTTASSGDGHDWQRVDLGFVSAYILYRDGGAALVDTGVAGSEGDIEAALGEIGLGWDAVGALVVTHLHPDHQGSVPAVLAATNEDLPWFAGAADIEAITAPTQGRPVGDGDSVFHGLQIIETPGHTPGHIAVLDQTAGILVAGDALTGTGDGVAGPNPDFTPDMATANTSVAKLAGFDYEIALFGHGEPILEGASAMVGELAGATGG